jgi:hypothetical protein
MRKRQKMRPRKSKKLFRATRRIKSLNYRQTGLIKRGGVRL